MTVVSFAITFTCMAVVVWGAIQNMQDANKWRKLVETKAEWWAKASDCRREPGSHSAAAALLARMKYYDQVALASREAMKLCLEAKKKARKQ